MNKLGILALAILLISTFAPLAFATGPTQPPVDTTTLYVGTIAWGPKRADPVRAYDTASGELIFNTYDTLIGMGTPVAHDGKSWDVQEQYWDFEPSLSTNVPERQEIIESFNETTNDLGIVIWNEEPIDAPFPIPIVLANTTWWEDDVVEPFLPRYAYHITNWIDTNLDGLVSPSDLVEVNVYEWAPELPLKVRLVQDYWFHVEQVDQLLPSPPPLPPHTVRLHLTYVADPTAEWPVCQWLKTADSGILYHICGFIDNNPDAVLGPCDVLYIKEYVLMQVVWDKIGAGFQLVSVTCRTWHVVNVALPVITAHRFYYDFILQAPGVIPFVDNTGAVVDTFDAEDAEYSIERGLVQDQYGSPMWMYYKPLFDQMDSSAFSMT